MPTFLICNECENERLVPEAVVEEMRREEQNPNEFICQRCFDIYYRPYEEEQMEREAYRHARKAS